jgi:hypothetical protein
MFSEKQTAERKRMNKSLQRTKRAFKRTTLKPPLKILAQTIVIGYEDYTVYSPLISSRLLQK